MPAYVQSARGRLQGVNEAKSQRARVPEDRRNPSRRDADDEAADDAVPSLEENRDNAAVAGTAKAARNVQYADASVNADIELEPEDEIPNPYWNKYNRTNFILAIISGVVIYGIHTYNTIYYPDSYPHEKTPETTFASAAAQPPTPQATNCTGWLYQIYSYIFP